MDQSTLPLSASATGDNSGQNDEKANPPTFIPKVECGEVINGVLQVTVTNFGDLMDRFGPESVVNTDNCLMIKFQPFDGRSNCLQKSFLIAWPEIENTEIGSGVMYFKVPVHLNAYNFQFCICGIHNETACPMADSRMQSVAVPSFLKDNNFKKGDTVSFRGITPSISCLIAHNNCTHLTPFSKRFIPYHRSQDR